MIEKRDDKLYYLTAQGKIVGTTVTLSKNEQLHQAHAVFFVTVRNSDGSWLLRKRLAQPMYGRAGFLHSEPVAGEMLEETARKALFEKTGFHAQRFVPCGSGFITLLDGTGEPESFISFTLLEAKEVSGELIANDGHGENYWYSGDFTEPEMIPSMPALVSLLQQKTEHFFVELQYTTNHERQRG